ncbi:PH domain-containing protein [Mariniflexile ostreae]|uniref:PH domain-containing protein n=1 Tax=Mariniflexile ostreae TaxID=1520892 RepID=A0ABV5FBS4_9FLAO
MAKTYKSKISYGLLSILFVLFFLPLLLSFIMNGIHDGFYILMGILILIYALILNVCLKTEYKIENGQLKIKCGFLVYKTILISEIKSIKKTNSLLSSPAPSFDRIAIAYGNFEEVFLSPKDKIMFAKALTDINPKIINKITEN